MTRKQRQQQNEMRLTIPASEKPRNPFATTAKMRKGVIVHGKSHKEQRHIDNMQLRQQLKNMNFDDN